MTPTERIRLMALLALGLEESNLPTFPPKRDIMELHGLGAEIWEEVDAQTYVHELRQEWDERP